MSSWTPTQIKMGNVTVDAVTDGERTAFDYENAKKVLWESRKIPVLGPLTDKFVITGKGDDILVEGFQLNRAGTFKMFWPIPI